MPDADKCRSCSADILWVKSASTGNVMPLDATPVPNGNIAIVAGKAVVLRGDLFEESLGGPRYQSHFVLCPAAAKFRKPRKAK